MYSTDVQKQIERVVTGGRGYYSNNRSNTYRVPYDLLNTEIGLQIALANMAVADGRLGLYDAIGFSSKLKFMMNKFKNAGIPLEAITDAQGFAVAFDSAYVTENLELSQNKNLVNALKLKTITNPFENYLGKVNSYNRIL